MGESRQNKFSCYLAFRVYQSTPKSIGPVPDLCPTISLDMVNFDDYANFAHFGLDFCDLNKSERSSDHV